MDNYVNTTPTVGFNCEKVKGRTGKSKGVSFTIWDIGGQDRLRPLWNTYMHHTEGECMLAYAVKFSQPYCVNQASSKTFVLYTCVYLHEFSGFYPVTHDSLCSVVKCKVQCRWFECGKWQKTGALVLVYLASHSLQ